MIRFATRNDIDLIMKFIDVFWKKGHILGNNREFFEYEHCSKDKVNFVISIDDKGEINGILGFIPYGDHFRDVMTVMWKVNQNAHASLGLELFKHLRDNGDVRIMASPGSNPKLSGLYRYLGYDFGKMIQWYRLRPQDIYNIANVENREIPECEIEYEYVLLDTWDLVKKMFDFDAYTPSAKPYKEDWYIKKRYYCHPVYKYNTYGILDNEKKAKLLVIFRVLDTNMGKVIRLVDCIGDFSYIRGISRLTDHILMSNKAEYADCYEVGLPDEYMREAGYLKVEGSGNVIPNYFSPFVQENIDIFYFSNDPTIVLFKGDGDQDRPS